MKKIISIILLFFFLFCGTAEAKRTPAEKRARKQQRKENLNNWWNNNKKGIGNTVGSFVLGAGASEYERRTGDTKTASQMREVGIAAGANANIVSHSGNMVSSQNKNEKYSSAIAIASMTYDKVSGEFSEVSELNIELNNFDLKYLQKMNQAENKEAKAAIKEEWLEGRKELIKQIGDVRMERKAEIDADCADEMLDARSDEERAAIFRRCKNCIPCYAAEIESRRLQDKEEQEDAESDNGEDFLTSDDERYDKTNTSDVDKNISVNNVMLNSQENTKFQRQQAAEEHKDALKKIESVQVSSYTVGGVALSQSQKQKLDDVADILKQYPTEKLLIVGHACDIGDEKINFEIGLKRAEAGKEYLVDKGIPADRISVDSKGKTESLVPNTSNENRKQNRRIEFVIK